MTQSAIPSTRIFYTDNDTESLADALKAAGVAQALRGWLGALHRASAPIQIEDKGGYHQITLPADLDESAVSGVSGAFAVGRPQLLVSKSQLEKANAAGRRLIGFDYETYKDKRDTYIKQYLSRPAAERAQLDNSPEADAIKRLAPPPDFPLYAYINQLTNEGDGYNDLIERWQVAPLATTHATLRSLLRAYAATPNPVEQAEVAWEAETGVKRGGGRVTRLQIINPTMGKGSNAQKAGALSIGGLDGFWLVEYLKFVGLFTLAAPLVVKGAKDRKTFVLRPVNVELGALDSVMERFRSRVRGNTAVKLDIVTTLRFTEELITYLRDAMVAGAPDPLLALFGMRRRLTDIARGFDVAFYKTMGRAFATMNLATVNLPGWLERSRSFATPAQADQTLALLEEHLRVISGISGIRTAKGDEGSDEYELLRRYRDFFSGHDLLGFLDFAARYGEYLLAKRHRNQWAGQFTTEGLDTLMKQEREKYGPIIENAGFRAIATAIRKATVSAQYRAARDRGFPYDVRYGLGQELLRAAAYPQEFLATLSGFIQSYNAESARIDERMQKGSLKGPYGRARVRTDELDAVVRLIDQYDGNSELICKLLVAYGYARELREAVDSSDQDAGDAGTSADEGEDDDLE